MKIFKYVLSLLLLAITLASCEETLELEPRGEQLTEAEILSDPASYEGLLAKLYAGLTVGGQEGADGNADISGIDGGFSNYLRLYWKHQELSTDEAIIAWNDGTIKDFQRQQWDDGNEFIRAMYSRVNYQIALANDFLRNTTEERLDEFNIEESDREEIREFRHEARFLRAYSYYHGMDLFGSMPFQDETTDPRTPGELIVRSDLFDYIEAELLDIEDDIAPARSNEYGRADQAAVWMTLAKIYLNSEVYTGESRYDGVVEYTQRVIDAGYDINEDQDYGELFFADNNSNGAQDGFIWTLNFDGQNTQTFGGTTFLTHAPVGGDMDPSEFGINGGWFGLRTTPEFVDLFDDGEDSDDGRALFFTDGQSKAINDESNFNQGFAIAKYRNIDVDGNQGSDATGDFVDIDFPVYRLADAYLMYAEAVLRGGGGSEDQAVDYINELRERAYSNDDDENGEIDEDDLDLDFIIDERGRELYWEAHRRQDLIRFNQFSSNGIWAWKGNVPTGTTTQQFRDLFSIPAEQLNLNDNLVQNPGY